jgi:hypothetical protein
MPCIAALRAAVLGGPLFVGTPARFRRAKKEPRAAGATRGSVVTNGRPGHPARHAPGERVVREGPGQ